MLTTLLSGTRFDDEDLLAEKMGDVYSILKDK